MIASTNDAQSKPKPRFGPANRPLVPGLIASRMLSGGTDAFTLSGGAAGLLNGYLLAAGGSALAMAGGGVLFPVQRQLSVQIAEYSIAGASATLKALEPRGWTIPSDLEASWALKGSGGGDWSRVMPSNAGWIRG